VIKSIRPALEFTEQDAAVIELKPLLQQFDISESRPCLLISQLNGAEQQCLNYQLLNAFTHVVMQSSLKPVFGESKPAEKLQKEFTECGRDYLVSAESMPPYTNFVATKQANTKQALSYFSQRQQHREIKAELESKFNASQSNAKNVDEELQQTKQQLQAAKQQSEEKQKQLGDELQHAKEQLQIAKKQSEEKQKQLGGELQQAKEQLQIAKQQSEEKQKQLGDELQQAKEQLQIAKQQSEEKQKQLGDELRQAKEQLQAAKQQSEEKQKQLGDELKHAKEQLQLAKQKSEEKYKELAAEKLQLYSELENLKEQCRELSESRDQHKHWHLENKKWAEGLVEKSSSLEKKLSDCEKQISSLESHVTTLKESYNASSIKEKDAVKTLALNTKLMSKLQSDLDELRFQYKEKVETEKALQKLIAELHLKLKQASVFYHNLESRFPEIASATKDLG
jgi:chromosome segregation ATPase